MGILFHKNSAMCLTLVEKLLISSAENLPLKRENNGTLGN